MVMSLASTRRCLDAVEYNRITVPESVHMGNPSGGYMELLKARNSSREHLIAWHDKQAMQDYLKDLMRDSNLRRKEYGTVVSSEANENGFELLNKFSWKAARQKYFDEKQRTPSCEIAYLAITCVRKELQVRFMWCLVGIRKGEYEATIETKATDQQLELMGALKVLIISDDSAIAWANRKNAFCFAKIVVDCFLTPVLDESVEVIGQRSMKREEVLLRVLLELSEDVSLQILTKELNVMDSYRRLEEMLRDASTKI